MKIKLPTINRKIAMSSFSIVAALSLLGGGAFAAFTTTATATGNTFSTTNPNLTITVGENTGPSVQGISFTGLIPGSNSGDKPFTLHLSGAGSNLPVTLKLSPTVNNSLPGSDVTINVTCGSTVETLSYTDWITTGATIGTVPNGGDLACTMNVGLNSGVGNSDAGKSAVFDANFTVTEGTP